MRVIGRWLATLYVWWRRPAGVWRDPWGQLVVLHRKRWRTHILAEHPELQDHLDWVQRAVETPDKGIYEDVTFAHRRCFYGQGASPRRGAPLLVKVVVQYHARHWKPAEVRTAYLVRRAKKGERPLWP